MEADVTVNSATHWARVFDFSNGPTADNVLLGLNGGKWSYQTYLGSSGQTIVADPVDTPYGTEMHMVLVGIDSGHPTDGEVVLYIDGAERMRQTVPLPAMLTRNTNLILRSPWASDDPLDGTVKNFKFYACDATNAPDTDAPPTDAPATDAPATDAPATDAPATDAPATDAPDTDAPPTDAPATDAPATDAPATDAPDTDAPPTDAPATDAPATDAPATDAPATDAPPTDAPGTDAPATDAPATDAPATDAPDTDAPATDAPATDAPATDAPATDAPDTDAPATDAPATDAPATDAPATDAPATDAPDTDAPATDAPATDAPATDAPDTDAPATDAPATDAPATDAPDTDAPATDAPATDAPATDAPATDPPATDAPATDAPATDAPDTDAPYTNAPPTDAPATNSPTTDAPATTAPDTDAPDTVAPPTNAPDAPDTIAPDTVSPDTVAPDTDGPATPATDAPATLTTAPHTTAPLTVKPASRTMAPTPTMAPVVSPVTGTPAVPGTGTPAPSTPVPTPAPTPAPLETSDVETPARFRDTPTSGLKAESKETLHVSSTVASTTAVLGGAAGNAGKLAVLNSFGCEMDDVDLGDETLDWEFHPLMFAMGSAHGKYKVAAMVMNPLLIMVVGMIAVGVSLATQHTLHYAKERALGLARFPGVLYVPYLFLLQGTSLVSTQVVFDASRYSAGVVVMAAAVLGVCLVSPALLYFTVLRHVERNAELFPDPAITGNPMTGEQGARAHSKLYKFAFGLDIWVSRESGHFAERYGICFENLRPGCLWYIVSELLCILCLSLLSGWKPTTKTACDTRNFSIAVMLTAFFLAAAIKRPFIAPMDNMIAIAMAFSMAAAVILMSIAITTETQKDAAIYTISMCLLLTAAVLIMAKCLWDFVIYAMDVCMIRRVGARELARDMRERKVDVDELELMGATETLAKDEDAHTTSYRLSPLSPEGSFLGTTKRRGTSGSLLASSDLDSSKIMHSPISSKRRRGTNTDLTDPLFGTSTSDHSDSALPTPGEICLPATSMSMGRTRGKSAARLLYV